MSGSLALTLRQVSHFLRAVYRGYRIRILGLQVFDILRLISADFIQLLDRAPGQFIRSGRRHMDLLASCMALNMLFM
jgi:hypothetical protein